MMVKINFFAGEEDEIPPEEWEFFKELIKEYLKPDIEQNPDADEVGYLFTHQFIHQFIYLKFFIK